jgi:hypothetical protein
MQKALQKAFSWFVKATPPRNGRKPKSMGQSLVEVGIAFPLLLMLFTGMVEFGFMLNTYLSLLDATRQTARSLANSNPFSAIVGATITDDMNFYTAGAGTLIDILDPPGDPLARSIVFDQTRDDIIISVIRVSVSEPTPPAIPAITSIGRFPQGLPTPYYRRFGNQLSAYADDTRIENLITGNGTIPVRTGILIIEIYYHYNGVLKLPWVQAFMPNNGVTLHADTVMPLVTAKPPRPTPPP